MTATVQPGRWYALVPCEACLKAIVFEELSSPDAATELAEAEVSVTCPHCGHPATYQPDVIQLVQAPQEE